MNEFGKKNVRIKMQYLCLNLALEFNFYPYWRTYIKILCENQKLILLVSGNTGCIKMCQCRSVANDEIHFLFHVCFLHIVWCFGDGGCQIST